MVRRSPGQQLARRRLGSALRRLREEANLRVEAAARELECSAAKISRLENGLGPAKLWEVRVLLNLYGVTDQNDVVRFEQWTLETRSPSWWESDADLTTDDLDRYLAVETAARCIQTYCTPLLPSQLQTAEYAAAHVRALYPQWRSADVERFVQLRLARREAVLHDEEPLRIDAVLDEGSIRRQVGGSVVHAAQLRWLVELLDEFDKTGRGNVVVRILPLSAGVPSRAVSTFTLFEPMSPDLDPVIAFTEETLGGTWLEADEVKPLPDIFEELTRMSLDPRESREFIRSVLREI